ncbi:MAG: transcription termination/antitermination protein NusA [Nitrospinota bacterium]|nr:MAG: transcription termination/antitermination protein NusA [Nitrospinota bacterium]
MNKELLQVLEQIEHEKGIDRKTLIEAMEAAILSASKKRFGSAENVRVVFDESSGEFRLFSTKTVVTQVTDPATEISLDQARQIDAEVELGEEVDVPLDIVDFGRIAAQTAKQVIIQRVREAEREIVYNEYKGKEGELVNGIVQRIERGGIIIDLGKTEALLPVREQSPRETFKRGDRIRAYIIEVRRQGSGPQIIVSRTHPGLLERLFEMEVPEIYEGIVEIKGAVREPNGRAKIAVYSHDKEVDPVGACVGMRGIRVQAVVQELRGEKIDIVQWTEDPVTFVCNALSPAKVKRVEVDEANRSMLVIVDDDQLSLAIGKKGQNVRLAAKLTKWKLDIKSVSQYQAETQQVAERELLFSEGEETPAVPAASSTDEVQDTEQEMEPESAPQASLVGERLELGTEESPEGPHQEEEGEAKAP